MYIYYIELRGGKLRVMSTGDYNTTFSYYYCEVHCTLQ